MTIEYYDAVNGDGLFNLLGKLFHAADTANTWAHGPVEQAVNEAIDAIELPASGGPDLAAAGNQTGVALPTVQSSTQAFNYQLSSAAESVLRWFVTEDSSQIATGLNDLLIYLIDEMEADGYYVTGNTATVVVAQGGSNVGDTVLVASVKRSDGRTLEDTLTEVIAAEVTTESDTTPTITLTGKAAVDRLACDWPEGSGATTSFRATNPAASLLDNGDFDDVSGEDDNLPDGWTVVSGTLGSSIFLTLPEVQTVSIKGIPSGGTYVLKWTDLDGYTWQTVPLAYNAGQSAVSAALNAIPGLESVTVTSTGTSPNYVHTVTFEGVPGDCGELTSVSALTGAAWIEHATTRAGNAGTYRGQCLEFRGQGATISLYKALDNLDPGTVYCLHCRLRRSTSDTTGTFTVTIRGEIGGAALQDDQSANLAASIPVALCPESDWVSLTLWIRLPATANDTVYLDLTATNLSVAQSLYINEVAIVEATEFYREGLWVAAFSGRSPSALEDSWTLTVENNREGQVQTWFDRFFDMKSKRLLLPISGSTAIPNTIIGGSEEEFSSSSSSSKSSSSSSSSSSQSSFSSASATSSSSSSSVSSSSSSSQSATSSSSSSSQSSSSSPSMSASSSSSESSQG